MKMSTVSDVCSWIISPMATTSVTEEDLAILQEPGLSSLAHIST